MSDEYCECDTEKVAVRMYMALLTVAGASVEKRPAALRGLKAIATLWPEPIDQFCKRMGMPPSVKEAQEQADE